MKKQLLALGLGLSVLGLGAHAQADEFDEEESQSIESAFVGESRARDTKVTSLNSNVEELAVENESVEAEIFADQDFVRSTSAETKALQNEINSLNRQIDRAISAQERSKKKAELVAKQHSLQKRLAADARANLAQAEKARKNRDRKLESLRDRVSNLKSQTADLRARNRDSKSALRSLESENARLNRQLRQLTAQIAREQRQAQSLREKKARLSQTNRRLRQASLQ